MNRSTAKCVLLISIFVLVVLAVVFSVAENEIALFITAVIWLIGYFVLTHKYLRCPNCGRWPGKYDSFARYCPRCGEPLE